MGVHLPANKKFEVVQDLIKKGCSIRQYCIANPQYAESTLSAWKLTFRKEGYLECHNTQAELAVKTLAKLRKTSMIFNNPESAKKNCDLLSIVQTALNHNVDVYEYLIYVIHYIDKAPTEDLLPWSDKLFTLPMPKCE